MEVAFARNCDAVAFYLHVSRKFMLFTIRILSFYQVQPVAAAIEAAALPPAPPPAAAPAPQKRADGRIVATPYAKKLAKELGVDLAAIGGTGPAGRITASDVEAAKNGSSAPSGLFTAVFDCMWFWQSDFAAHKACGGCIGWKAATVHA